MHWAPDALKNWDQHDRDFHLKNGKVVDGIFQTSANNDAHVIYYFEPLRTMLAQHLAPKPEPLPTPTVNVTRWSQQIENSIAQTHAKVLEALTPPPTPTPEAIREATELVMRNKNFNAFAEFEAKVRQGLKKLAQQPTPPKATKKPTKLKKPVNSEDLCDKLRGVGKYAGKYFPRFQNCLSVFQATFQSKSGIERVKRNLFELWFKFACVQKQARGECMTCGGPKMFLHHQTSER